MSKIPPLNELIRRRIRELRLNRKMKSKELAALAGIPLSSYSCMEKGVYNISLEHLYRILGVLDADILDVWPVERLGEELAESRVYLRRIQESRLIEIVSLSKGEGGALFRVRNGECDLLLHHNLSDFLLDRLILYLADGRLAREGVWFERARDESTFHLLLKAEPPIPEYLKKLVSQYLAIWSSFFDRGTRPR